MKKLVLFSTLAFAVVLLSGCMDKDQDVASQNTVMTGETTTNTTTGETNTGTIVGNDKDEHGCIASAGYTRNEAKKECTRSREE